MKSHYTCPYCCQLIQIEAEGKVTKVNKPELGTGSKGKAEPDSKAARPDEYGVSTNINQDAL